MVPCLSIRLPGRLWTRQSRVRTLCGLNQWLVTPSPETLQEEKLNRIKAAREAYSLRYRQFPTSEFRIAGVSFNNRQSLLESIHWGEVIICEREPYNEYDSNAVRISLLDGNKLGYVPRDLTSLFRQCSTAGRLKSVGRGEGGYYGAIAFVQPQLPALLPVPFPKKFEFLSKILSTLSTEERVRISAFLKSKNGDNCHFTGLENDLIPQLSWRVHFDKKQYQLSEVCLMSEDLTSADYTPEGVTTLAAVNGWTKQEAESYVERWNSKQSEILDSDWSIDVEVLESLLKELQIVPPMKLQDYLKSSPKRTNLRID